MQKIHRKPQNEGENEICQQREPQKVQQEKYKNSSVSTIKTQNDD